MEKSFIEWNGEKFPIREVALPEDLGGFTTNVADYNLWAAIEADYDKGNREAKEIDNEIYYYCDCGFIASDPTDEEIIDYLIDNVC